MLNFKYNIITNLLVIHGIHTYKRVINIVSTYVIHDNLKILITGLKCTSQGTMKQPVYSRK